MALAFTVDRRAADAGDVDAAIARLDAVAGIYFGCDAGVAGLHPLQATLVVAPALAIRIYDDGAEVDALDPFGRALLRDPTLDTFVGAAERGAGRSALVALRAFLAAFGGSDGALLVGALRFDAHRLALPAPRSKAASTPLGVLFFAPQWLRRDGTGAWQHVTLQFEATELAAVQPRAGSNGVDRAAVSFRKAVDGSAVDGSRAVDVAEVDAPDVDGSASDRSAVVPSAVVAPAVDRQAVDRQAVDRQAVDRQAVDRQAVDESGVDRSGVVAPAVDAARAFVDTADAGRGGGPADDFPRGGYAAVVARALHVLERQPLVSLTLSQSFRRAVGSTSAATAFAGLRRGNPAPATFFVNAGDGERLFGASPDLQLVVRGRDIESLPVCGTVARGHGPMGEAESFRRLIDEDVDAASLAVCTDALRNDLAPLCEPGSLRLRDRRRPLALATVVHTVDRFGGRLRDGVDAWDAIVATAAPVMVTGTPRRLALAAIDALEASPRGWYGGLVVEVDAAGDARVGTILRAAALRDGIAEVRTGGDLMADSNPEREEDESRIKAVSLWRALAMPVAADLQQALAGANAAAPAASVAPTLPPAVALRDAGDAFMPAVADTLRGLGLAVDDAAPALVLVGAAADECAAAAAAAAARGAGIVAIGDAGVRLLERAGFAVAAIGPEHGRPLQCLPHAGRPGLPTRPFGALRYATLAVDWTPATRAAAAARWTTWVVDPGGDPLVLANAHERTVCVLFRPESLLSSADAREVLRTAIAFAATAPQHASTAAAVVA